MRRPSARSRRCCRPSRRAACTSTPCGRGGPARRLSLPPPALRAAQAGQRAFVSTHVLVPGDWTVRRGHDVAEEVEAALHERLPYATVFTHVEPSDDPRSFEDTELDRARSLRLKT